MVASFVSLAEILRPWRVAGVTHFLDDPTYTFLSNVVSGQPEVGLNQPAIFTDATLDSTSSLQDFSLVSSGFSQKKLIDPEEWPTRWRVVLPKRKGSLLLWSYAELGFDLGGNISSERSSCLKEIIKHLNMPAGTSVFWPVGVSDDTQSDISSLQADPAIFQAGIEYLNPKAIILLGDNAFKMGGFVLKAPAQPYSQHIVKGRMIICLPPFSQILQSRQNLDRAKAFMRTVVAKLRSQVGGQ